MSTSTLAFEHSGPPLQNPAISVTPNDPQTFQTSPLQSFELCVTLCNTGPAGSFASGCLVMWYADPCTGLFGSDSASSSSVGATAQPQCLLPDGLYGDVGAAQGTPPTHFTETRQIAGGDSWTFNLRMDCLAGYPLNVLTNPAEVAFFFQAVDIENPSAPTWQPTGPMNAQYNMTVAKIAVAFSAHSFDYAFSLRNSDTGRGRVRVRVQPLVELRAREDLTIFRNLVRAGKRLARPAGPPLLTLGVERVVGGPLRNPRYHAHLANTGVLLPGQFDQVRDTSAPHGDHEVDFELLAGELRQGLMRLESVPRPDEFYALRVLEQPESGGRAYESFLAVLPPKTA